MPARQQGTLAALALLAIAAPAAANPVADFYRGKLLTVVTWQGPGSSFDAYARMIGRHMGKYIPGAPQFRVQLMLGGGGIVAANHMASVAPKDGTVLFMVGPGLVVEQALGLNKSLTADLRAYGMLGNLAASNQVLVTWHTSPTNDLATAMTRETTVGATGVGSTSYQLPSFYNNMVGTRFKIITGYGDARLIETAMERGELEGRATNQWATYKSSRPDWVAQNLIVPIIQVGRKKETDLPHVPLLRDLVKREKDRPAFEFITNASAVGRPVATTPDVPKERLAALRAAFDKLVVDPEFVDEVAKHKLDLDPMPAAEMEALIRSMIELPPAVLQAIKKATEPPR
jgi:tripartite-type tricarboxylate transporter receptor subunit TctC